jgi:hypothetical protein
MTSVIEDPVPVTVLQCSMSIMASLRFGVPTRKETKMKATPLILALLLATGAGSALAQTGGNTGYDSTTRATAEKFVQPSEKVKSWEQSDQAQKAQLDREGFPQYTY